MQLAAFDWPTKYRSYSALPHIYDNKRVTKTYVERPSLEELQGLETSGSATVDLFLRGNRVRSFILSVISTGCLRTMMQNPALSTVLCWSS